MRVIVNICAFISLFSIAIHAAAVDSDVAAREPQIICPTPPLNPKFGIGPECIPGPPIATATPIPIYN